MLNIVLLSVAVYPAVVMTGMVPLLCRPFGSHVIICYLFFHHPLNRVLSKFISYDSAIFLTLPLSYLSDFS